MKKRTKLILAIILILAIWKIPAVGFVAGIILSVIICGFILFTLISGGIMAILLSLSKPKDPPNTRRYNTCYKGIDYVSSGRSIRCENCCFRHGSLCTDPSLYN